LNAAPSRRRSNGKTDGLLHRPSISISNAALNASN
jgi:hypothetical protein